MEQWEKLMKVPVVGQAMGQLFPLLGLVTVLKQAMPAEGRQAMGYCRRAIGELLNPFCFYTIDDFEGSLPNELYKDIHLHLESIKAYNKAKRVNLFRKPNTAGVTMRLADSSDVVVDVYKGITVWWTHTEVKDKFIGMRGPYSGGGDSTSWRFQLKIRKKDKAKLLPEYLDYITRNSHTYSGKTRDIKIFTNSNSSHSMHNYLVNGTKRMWEEIPYRHPSTFDTLAMDPCLKETIISDLTSFATDQAFYQKTGRAWKRGYLLHGPPGTGKSSMIAAMANFLKYDIYDLELSQVRKNGDLRRLLIQTSNRSIIVLEDIDCSVNFAQRRGLGSTRTTTSTTPAIPGDSVNLDDDPTRVTLSGLLNFVDGLWSCCGDERIFVFTTNHVEKLDKALLRPGRMDMQIELSFCTFPAFKVLAQSYLSTHEHPLFARVESAFQGKTLTPAQIAELLIKDKRNVDLALENVISALENNVPESPDIAVAVAVPASITQEVVNDEFNENRNNSVTNSTANGVKDQISLTAAESKSVDHQGNLISTLQGVIKELEKYANPSSKNKTEPAQFGNLHVAPSTGAPSGSQQVEPKLEFSSSSMKKLVQALRDTLENNKGDVDSSMEGVIQVLQNKLPINSEIQLMMSSSSDVLLANKSSSQAATNGVC